MEMDMRAYVKSLGIHDCRECEEIVRLQAQENKDIRAAPLFWQGAGQVGIPLVLIGINPSLVGTSNEPLRGGDFDQYFDYYQDRARSEEETRRLPKPKRVPFAYWTSCENLAKEILGGSVERWRDYMLMEVIHCFFDRTNHLGQRELDCVAGKCFNRHTRKILEDLMPQKIVLLGNPVYDIFRKFMGMDAVEKYEIGSIRLGGRTIRVMRHPHRGDHIVGGWYRPGAYKKF
jgi:hypothetical protein